MIIDDPFMNWWSFEYIPIVFGFCLMVVLVSVVLRHVRRQRLRAWQAALGGESLSQSLTMVLPGVVSRSQHRLSLEWLQCVKSEGVGSSSSVWLSGSV